MSTYLKYLWRSTNEHGVHSPFVFDLVTKALRSAQTHPEHHAVGYLPFFHRLSSKQQRALNNAIHHLFEDRPIRVATIDSEVRKTPGETADLIYLDLTGNHDIPGVDQLTAILSNDTPLVILKNGEHPLWSALMAHPAIHLTIDLHRTGIVWKRAQQAKENFTIRL